MILLFLWVLRRRLPAPAVLPPCLLILAVLPPQFARIGSSVTMLALFGNSAVMASPPRPAARTDENFRGGERKREMRREGSYRLSRRKGSATFSKKRFSDFLFRGEGLAAILSERRFCRRLSFPGGFATFFPWKRFSCRLCSSTRSGGKMPSASHCGVAVALIGSSAAMLVLFDGSATAACPHR